MNLNQKNNLSKDLVIHHKKAHRSLRATHRHAGPRTRARARGRSRGALDLAGTRHQALKESPK